MLSWQKLKIQTMYQQKLYNQLFLLLHSKWHLNWFFSSMAIWQMNQCMNLWWEERTLWLHPHPALAPSMDRTKYLLPHLCTVCSAVWKTTNNQAGRNLLFSTWVGVSLEERNNGQDYSAMKMWNFGVIDASVYGKLSFDVKLFLVLTYKV